MIPPKAADEPKVDGFGTVSKEAVMAKEDSASTAAAEAAAEANPVAEPEAKPEAEPEAKPLETIDGESEDKVKAQSVTEEPAAVDEVEKPAAPPEGSALMFADEESDDDAPKVLRKRRPKTSDEPSASAPGKVPKKRGRKSLKEMDEEAAVAPPPVKFASLGARAPKCLTTKRAVAAPPARSEVADLSLNDLPAVEDARYDSEEPFKVPGELNPEAMEADVGSHTDDVGQEGFGQPSVHPELLHGLGGTPVDDQGRSLLFWSQTGSVMRTGDDGTWLYEIEHGDGIIRFRSQNCYVKGAVGRTGFALASPTGIKVSQFAFGKERLASEYELDVVSGESVCTCCVTDERVAVCTERNGYLLRLYTLGGGICTAMMSLPGAPVVCVGGGSRLAIFYNCGTVLRVRVLDLSKNTTICELPVCLGGQNQLSDGASQMKWCHISSTERLYILDDTNTLRHLARQFDDWTWLPVLKLPDNPEVGGKAQYHPHSVEDDKPEALFKYAKLPASGILPLAPRPMTDPMPLCFPCSIVTGSPEEKAFRTGEETALRKEIWYTQELISARATKKLLKTSKKQMDRALVTMFAQATAQGQAARCMDLAKRIQLRSVLDNAGKLAYEQGLPSVSERIAGILRERAVLEVQQQQHVAATPLNNPTPAAAGVSAPASASSSRSTSATPRFGSKPVPAGTKRSFGAPAPSTTESSAAAAKKRKTNPFSRK